MYVKDDVSDISEQIFVLCLVQFICNLIAVNTVLLKAEIAVYVTEV